MCSCVAHTAGRTLNYRGLRARWPETQEMRTGGSGAVGQAPSPAARCLPRLGNSGQQTAEATAVLSPQGHGMTCAPRQGRLPGALRALGTATLPSPWGPGTQLLGRPWWSSRCSSDSRVFSLGAEGRRPRARRLQGRFPPAPPSSQHPWLGAMWPHGVSPSTRVKTCWVKAT